MTRQEATEVLRGLIEQVEARPEVHRQLWEAIAVLAAPLEQDAPAVDVEP